MTVRGTSLEAYQKIIDSGALSHSREVVYTCLFQNGPLTAQEVFKRLGLETNQSGRFTELEELGVIRAVGERACSVTQNNATVWIVTEVGSVTPRSKKVSQKQRLKDLLGTYARNYPQSCGCSAHGRDSCLLHQSLDAIS